MVSIIIAVKGWNDFLKESLQACNKLVERDFEIIVLPDQSFAYDNPSVRVIASGACLPAKKRDIGAEYARGEILAFLDDDAYPSEMWLTHALKAFANEDVAAVGGPAVTPNNEDFERKASGLVYESFAASGNFRYRYVKGEKRFVDDYPSCNLLIRKDIFNQIGGFKTNFWPGEDTFLCLEITKRLNKKIVYDPGVLVFHHRRALFLPHLRQIMNYARHRGYFVKRFPETSLRWQYFIPSIFLTLLVLGGVAAIFNHMFSIVYGAWFLSYLIFIFINAFDRRNLKMTLYVTVGIFLTHICYGLFFITGLCLFKLQEEGEA